MSICASYSVLSSAVTSPDLQKEKNVTKSYSVMLPRTLLSERGTSIEPNYFFLGVISILGCEALPSLPLSTLIPFRIRAFDQFLGPQDRELFEAALLQKDRS